MYIKLKKVLDMIFAIILLIITLPIMIVTSFFILILMGRPVIFKQNRVGKNCKIFTIYKFRTMTNEKNANGILEKETVRLTKIGKIIRKLSIDELPQLVNILKGDMSFIGPRPLLIRYLPHYTEEENKRHDILPGITGYAQVKGRNNIDWTERFYYDNEYRRNISLKLDFQILVLTINNILFSKNISVKGTNSLVDFDVLRQNN